MYANGVPKNFGSKQSKIQQKTLFLFPESQETKYAPVVVELMKIQLTICISIHKKKRKQNEKDETNTITTALVTMS